MKRLSSIDANFLNTETHAAPMHYLLVAVVEAELTLAQVERVIEANLPELLTFTQKVTPNRFRLGRPSWQADPLFNLDRHLFEVQLTPADELLAVGAKIFAGVMDRGKPLWELYLVHGLSEGRSAVFLKVHCCMTDGAVSLEPLTAVSAMRGTEQSISDQRASPRQSPDVIHTATASLGHGEYSSADVRAIGATCGAAMRDVMLAVLTGGIRRYRKLHQQPTANESLRVMLSPVSAIDIPLDLNDPLECLEYVTAMSQNASDAREKRGKSSKFPSSIYVTTVPPPKSPLNLFGKRALAIYPFPNIPRGAGIRCAVFEYLDKVNLQLTMGTHTGAQRLQSCLDQSFLQLRHATGVTQQTTFNELLQQAPETDRYELLSEYVREQVAIVLNWEDEQPPDPQQGFFDLGLDSLSTLKLGDRLQAGFGRQLPVTLIFDTPNIDALTNYLAREVLGWNELHSEPAVDTGNTQADTAHQLLEKIQYLSDDDVDRLLAKTSDPGMGKGTF